MVLNIYKKLKSTIDDLIIDKHFNIYNRNGYEYILSKIKKQPEFYIYLIDFDGVKEMNKKIGYSEVNNIFRNIFDELKDKFIIGRAFSGDEIFFANKNINKYDIDDIEKVAKKYNIEQILKNNPTLTIQGEQGDTNVQGNKYGLKEPRMWVFNIIDHEKNYFYNFYEIRDFCIDNDLEYVPLLQAGELSSFGTTVEEIVNYAKGKSTLANIPREGVVFRCVENGHKLSSFKAINPDFLLKYE